MVDEAPPLDSLDELTPLVYDELRRIARRYLRRGLPAASVGSTRTPAWEMLAGDGVLYVTQTGHKKDTLAQSIGRSAHQIRESRERARIARILGAATSRSGQNAQAGEEQATERLKQ